MDNQRPRLDLTFYKDICPDPLKFTRANFKPETRPELSFDPGGVEVISSYPVNTPVASSFRWDETLLPNAFGLTQPLRRVHIIYATHLVLARLPLVMFT